MDSELQSQRRPPPLLLSSVIKHPFIFSAVFVCFSVSSSLFAASVVVLIALCFAFCRRQREVRMETSQEIENRSKPEVGIEEDAETRDGYRSYPKEKRDFSPEELDNVSDTLSLPESTITLLESDNKEWSDGSISDDDSLIEISLPGGHYLEDRIWENDSPSAAIPKYLFQKQHFQVMESPGTLFRRKTFMDFSSELIEEDNLIEIDISMGSIKCSTVETKA